MKIDSEALKYRNRSRVWKWHLLKDVRNISQPQQQTVKMTQNNFHVSVTIFTLTILTDGIMRCLRSVFLPFVCQKSWTEFYVMCSIEWDKLITFWAPLQRG